MLNGNYTCKPQYITNMNIIQKTNKIGYKVKGWNCNVPKYNT